MKLHRRTFQIFWDVHAWAGVASALLLYLMFFTGAFALFYPELNAWAEPSSAPAARVAPALQPLFTQLVREEHALERARIDFSMHDANVTVYLRNVGDERELRYAPERGRLEPMRSKLGSFLYELHYLGQIPCGVYVAGVAGMAMFLTVVSGVLIQLKDLVRQWFQFRPRQAARVWSSDMHKLLGVFGLPFQLLYAWSGAVLCLAYVTLQPAFVATVFRGDNSAEAAAHGYPEPPAKAGKRSARIADLDDLIAAARVQIPGFAPEYVAIENPGDEASVIEIYGRQAQLSFANAELTFEAGDGHLLRNSTSSTAGALQRFEAWFFGLHYARFGGYGLKWVYALLAFGTCAVLVTGNWIWLERRDPGRARLGNRLLSRLTVGFACGVPLAVASLFVGNRSLPADIERRTSLEQAVFWTVLAAALLWPFCARSDRRVAGRQLTLAGVLFLLALTLDLLFRRPFFADPVQRGVCSALLSLALLCAGAGVRLLRLSSEPLAEQAAASRKPRALASASE